jgi:hypothetical protein
VTEPEQKDLKDLTMIPINQEEANKVIEEFGSIVKELNMELSNKELSELIMALPPTVMKLELAIHILEARVTELENKK